MELNWIGALLTKLHYKKQKTRLLLKLWHWHRRLHVPQCLAGHLNYIRHFWWCRWRAEGYLWYLFVRLWGGFFSTKSAQVIERQGGRSSLGNLSGCSPSTANSESRRLHSGLPPLSDAFSAKVKLMLANLNVAAEGSHVALCFQRPHGPSLISGDGEQQKHRRKNRCC